MGRGRDVHFQLRLSMDDLFSYVETLSVEWKYKLKRRARDTAAIRSLKTICLRTVPPSATLRPSARPFLRCPPLLLRTFNLGHNNTTRYSCFGRQPDRRSIWRVSKREEGLLTASFASGGRGRMQQLGCFTSTLNCTSQSSYHSPFKGPS